MVGAVPSHVAPKEESCAEVEEREAKRQCKEAEVKCQECGENESKYRCPGCGLRSCGLPCVKRHKERTQCSGKRNRTAFVRVSEFDENVLISDYNLLEETLRQAEAAKRLRVPLVGDGGRNELHPALRALQRQAMSRSTSLLFLAQGMSKRKANSSFYERKTRRIFWRVEWTFEGTEVQLVDARVDENLTLETILSKHLNGINEEAIVKYRLKKFCWKPVNELKLLLIKERTPAAEKAFYELDLKATLRSQLEKKTIIEHPVIKVVLPEEAGKFIIIAPVKKPLSTDADQYQADGPITPNLHQPEGIPLREEEIEDGIPEEVPSGSLGMEDIEEGEFVP